MSPFFLWEKRMKVLFSLAACLLVVAADEKTKKEDAKAKKDQDAIVGSWRIESQMPVDPTGTKWTDIEIKSGELFLKTRTIVLPFTYKLDSSTKPASIDITPSGRQTLQGIYELNGDDLKICYSVVAELPRPTKFAGSPGYLLFTLKRAKKEKADDK
jgi:uncharacterized protein (TIGR03067 family)